MTPRTPASGLKTIALYTGLVVRTYLLPLLLVILIAPSLVALVGTAGVAAFRWVGMPDNTAHILVVSNDFENDQTRWSYNADFEIVEELPADIEARLDSASIDVVVVLPEDGADLELRFRPGLTDGQAYLLGQVVYGWHLGRVVLERAGPDPRVKRPATPEVLETDKNPTTADGERKVGGGFMIVALLLMGLVAGLQVSSGQAFLHFLRVGSPWRAVYFGALAPTLIVSLCLGAAVMAMIGGPTNPGTALAGTLLTLAGFGAGASIGTIGERLTAHVRDDIRFTTCFGGLCAMLISMAAIAEYAPGVVPLAKYIPILGVVATWLEHIDGSALFPLLLGLHTLYAVGALWLASGMFGIQEPIVPYLWRKLRS